MNIVIWALATGGITGAVWVAIVMFQRQRRIDHGRRDLDELDARLEELEGAEQRVAELEERLDFAERILAQKRSEPEERK
ncbi:MAG: hypothetical protein ABJB33_04470 [Gemmatimonadota bacterium]